MPIYEYRCSCCTKTMEILQKTTDPAPLSCPICHAEKTMEKQVSHTSFQLKGSGWYKDLYASSKTTSPSSASNSTCGTEKCGTAGCATLGTSDTSTT